jgi:hypothetical protein
LTYGDGEDLSTERPPLSFFDPDEEDFGTPQTPAGLIFLRHITIPPEASMVRFMDSNCQLPDRMFKKIFEKSLEEIEHKVNPSGFRTRDSVPKSRHPERKTLTSKRNRDDYEQDPDNATFPQLNNILVEFETPEYGPDLEENAMPVYIQPAEPMGLTVDRLFAQYASDIIQKIGNPKDVRLGSYCPLNRGARERITLDDITTADLGKLFTTVQWQQATAEEWYKNFNHLFPRKNHITPSSAQHYHLMAYYAEWKKAMLQLSDEDAGNVRASMFQRYNTLVWVPAASGDRLWNYSRTEGWNNLPPAQGLRRNQGGPKVYFSPKNGVNPTLRTAEDIAREALREEEEEGSAEE